MVTHHVQNSEFGPVEGEMHAEIDALKAKWVEFVIQIMKNAIKLALLRSGPHPGTPGAPPPTVRIVLY